MRSQSDRMATFYVIDAGNNRIASFDTNGNFLDAFAVSGTVAPTALTIDAKKLL